MARCSREISVAQDVVEELRTAAAMTTNSRPCHAVTQRGPTNGGATCAPSSGRHHRQRCCSMAASHVPASSYIRIETRSIMAISGNVCGGTKAL